MGLLYYIRFCDNEADTKTMSCNYSTPICREQSSAAEWKNRCCSFKPIDFIVNQLTLSIQIYIPESLLYESHKRIIIIQMPVHLVYHLSAIQHVVIFTLYYIYIYMYIILY